MNLCGLCFCSLCDRPCFESLTKHTTADDSCIEISATRRLLSTLRLHSLQAASKLQQPVHTVAHCRSGLRFFAGSPAKRGLRHETKTRPAKITKSGPQPADDRPRLPLALNGHLTTTSTTHYPAATNLLSPLASAPHSPFLTTHLTLQNDVAATDTLDLASQCTLHTLHKQSRRSHKG